MAGPVQAPVEDARRARRFEIAVPVRFRPAGGDWLDGRTVNVSRIGLLFSTAHAAPGTGTSLEARFTLPTAGHPGAQVVCAGRVVRVEALTGCCAAVAMVIDEHYMFPPSRDRPSR